MAEYMRLENDALEMVVFIIPKTLTEKFKLMWQAFRGRTIGTMYVQNDKGKRTKSYLIAAKNQEQIDELFGRGEQNET